MPDHVSLWGSLLKFRREFDQYINLRPVRLFDGVPCPLAGRKPGDIDFFVVRENTEGEYTNLGGSMFEGTEREFVIQESVFSRHGTDRVLKYAFELAQVAPAQAPDGGHQVATASRSACRGGTGAPTRSASDYPDVTVDKQHIDILSRALRAAAGRASTSWWRATCSATSCPTWARPAPARSAWRRRPT